VLLGGRIVPQTGNDLESGRTNQKPCRVLFQPGKEIRVLKRESTLGTAIGASDAPENERQEASIIDIGERVWSSRGTRSAGAPAKNAAIEMIDAERVAARMFVRTLLNQHIHLSRRELERAHVEIAADELDREAISRNEQAGFPWTSHRHPNALNQLKVGANR